MLKPNEIQKTLRAFNLQGYSDPNTQYQDNGKGGKILTLTQNNWKYEDEYYGGEPYSGNETLWYNDKPVFRCVYWGKVAKNIEFSDIYDFLKQALQQGTTGNCVHRGPGNFTQNILTYTNTCSGTIEEFQQIEKIFVEDREVYVAVFVGGSINVR